MSNSDVPEETSGSASPLWPILVETVHRLPMYPHHTAYIRDRPLLEKPNISAEEIPFRLDISLGEAMVILHELGFDERGRLLARGE